MKLSTRNSPAVRLMSVVTIGVVAVIGMFAMLYRLVDVPFDPGPVVKPGPIVYSPVKLPPPIVDDPRPPKPEPDEPTEVTSISTLVDSGPSTIDKPGPYVGTPIDPIGIGDGLRGNGGIQIGGGNDRDVLVQLRIPPLYPPSAESRGIEGWVRVQFTITATGSVRDARVVSAEPRGVFDEAALTAIARWRYNPRIVDGVPVESVGMQTEIQFELAE